MLLQELGLKYGTDKATHHQFCDFYDQYFSNLRDQYIKFLEIGVFEGASACMWKEYFPNAELHFIDYLPELKNKLPDNCVFHLVDCHDESALYDFSQKEQDFDIILDDGAHTMKAQQLTFKHLFPLVKQGGFYSIEDLHTSFGYRLSRCNQDNTKSTTYEMLEILRGQKHTFESNHVSFEYLIQQRKTIDFMQIFNPSGNLEKSVTSIIRKKSNT
jgi:flavodoxin